MRKTPLEHKIEQIVAPVIADMGLSLFAVKIIGEGGSRNVQIMAEEPATKNLGVDKCAEISRSVSALLDVEDIIEGAYRLEVSSPGIDRLLLTPAHFEEYKGHEARLESDTPIETGQKKFKGILQGIENDIVKINTEQGEAEIPFSNLIKAKLVLTDNLIKSTAKS